MAEEFVILAAQVREYLRAGVIKVLLVEDNPGDVAMFSKILAKSEIKFAVDAVMEPEEAMRVIRERRHNVVVLDWNLGHDRKTGLEIVQHLHAEKVFFPFMFLTAHAEEDFLDALNLDGLGFLHKDNLQHEQLEWQLAHAFKEWYSRQSMNAARTAST